MALVKSETGYLRASWERTKEEEVAYDESLVEPIINRGVEFWVVHYMGTMIVGMFCISQICQINDGGNLPVSTDFLPLVNGGPRKNHLVIITVQRKERSNPSISLWHFCSFHSRF